MVVVIVGDRKQVEDRLRKLNVPVVVVDEQARPVPATPATTGSGPGR